MDLADHIDRPDWQDEVDFSALKLKLVASIGAISGVHLPKVFMDVGQYDPEQIRWMVIIHPVFVISGVLLAIMDWIANHARSLKYRKPASGRGQHKPIPAGTRGHDGPAARSSLEP